MTREEIGHRAAELMLLLVAIQDKAKVLDICDAAITDAVRATLQEAAREVCCDCAAGVQLLQPAPGMTWAHPDDDGYRYDCAASKIHDFLAALDKEES